MQENLLQYLSQYAPLTHELAVAIKESAYIRHYQKGSVLLKEGALCNECYFILKGCARSYLIKDGMEQTVEFFTEQQILTPTNYASSRPSDYYIECVEETFAAIGNPALEKEAFENYPELKTLAMTIAEKVLAKKEEHFRIFKTSSPEERYLHLLKMRPTLIQRVPQYQIASYLGITPESLSRIRKRILTRS